MDIFLDAGIRLIVLIQSLGSWLEVPMRFFTFLGEEMFFLLVLPALYWCINVDLGARVGFILLTSVGLNDTLKLVFHGVRPYWYSTAVKPFAFEGSFGVPSGHAQNAAAVWGMLASRIKRGWVWAIALVLIFFIGFSRLYLAVHFPHDVLLGWVIGFMVLWLFTRYWDRVVEQVARLQPHNQILLALGVSLGMIALSTLTLLLWGRWSLAPEWAQNAAAVFPDELLDPTSLSGIISAAAMFFGLAAGMTWLKQQGGYEISGPLWQRVARYAIGIVGLFGIYFGLKAIFPEGATLVAYFFRYVRYTLVVLWVSALAPMLFMKIRLAGIHAPQLEYEPPLQRS